jgi:hypothetical protein
MKFSKLLWLVVCLTALVSCSDDSKSYASNINAKDIVGSWNVGGGVAKIDVVDGNKLELVTETGVKGSGSIVEGKLEVPSWKVSGQVATDFKSIHWSNNITWVR